MKVSILVVDDDFIKIESIKNFIETSAIADVEIVSVGDVSEARKALLLKQYDVMLLDILLPTRKGADPRADSSVDFLRQILEDETCPAPKRIVAITSNQEALALYAKEFGRFVTQSILVDPVDDEWKYSLDRLINHAKLSSYSTYDYDFCIQTALRVPELSQVLKVPGVQWQAEEPLGNGILYRRGVLERAGRQFKVACAHAPQMGMVSATHLTGLLISKLRPKLLFMTGICGSIDKSINLGDLVVADRSWDWQSGKWNQSGELEFAPEQKEATADVVADARGLESGLIEWYSRFEGSKPDRIPALKVTPIVSGSSVVADASFHADFKKQHRKVGAVDMECFGLYYAASMSDSPQPKFICMKAVSDAADQTKADDIQAYCSYLSAAAAIELAAKILTRIE